MRTSLVILTMLPVALLLAANSAFAVVNSPLNGGFEDPAPDPPWGPSGGWGIYRTDNGIANWDLNDTIPLQGNPAAPDLYSTQLWRYGGDWSPYVEENGDALLGLFTFHDWAQYGGVQQDLGTMELAGDTYTLGATLYAHQHRDENTVWDLWENSDAATYQLVFYNVDDGVVLESLTDEDVGAPVLGFKGGYLDIGPETVAVSMGYTAQESDVGDTLRLLLLPRDTGVDGFQSHTGIDDVTVLTNVIQPDWLDGLSRGHNILLQRGLQIQALTSPEFDHPTKQFDLDRWEESNFTTAHFWANNYPVDQMSPPPGIPWGLTDYDDVDSVQGDIEPEAYPYASSLVSYQHRDEQNITSSAELAYLKSSMASFHVKRPNVITYTNQYGTQFSYSQLQNYMREVEPDMLCFDTYPFKGNLQGGSPTTFYEHMQKYRQLGLAGNDGTGTQPIPYALYTQTFTYDGVNRHIVSESEIRLNNFAAWAFGFTFVDAFMYDPKQYGSEADYFGPVLFTGGDTNLPTPQFYQVAETNRQSLNLGPALVRLISTDVRVNMGQHWVGDWGEYNNMPNGVANWDSNADPYITSIDATNLGGLNSELDGDVIIGYFKPLDASFTNDGHEDDIYFMIVNGLSDATGSAADCQQRIHVSFDFGTSGIDSLLRLSRETGQIEKVGLIHGGGSLYSLDLYLDGGTGDLFKFNNGGLFVALEFVTIPGDANGDCVVNDADAAILAANWQTLTGATWSMGDFNDDGKVNDADATILATNWRAGVFGTEATVPEPTSLVLLMCLVGLASLARRGHARARNS